MDIEKAAQGAGGIAAQGSGKAESDDQNSGTVCRESFENPVYKPSAPTDADDDKASPGCAAQPAACERWNELEGEFLKHFGEQVFNSWIAVLFPESDDGETLVLACATAMIKDYVTEHFLKDLQTIVGRTIKIETRAWAAGATTRVDRKGDHAVLS